MSDRASQESIQIMLRKFALVNSIFHQGKSETGAVIGRVMAERADLRNKSRMVSALAAEVLNAIRQLTLEQQKDALSREFPNALDEESKRRKEISRRDSERGATLPPLPGAVSGAVVTRFPPEPNGFMHIGHAKAAVVGSEYARIYGGKFIMRFDDTNPAVERKEFYEAFLEAFVWLGIKPDLVRNASDDMETFYELANKMIRGSSAYVCMCTQELMRERRSRGEVCQHRSQTVEQDLELWSKMKSGETEKSGAVLRFVGDMQSVNTTMRDPVLFRMVHEPHPIQGTKYKVWPTYDFDGPVEDSLDGVTHAMRSKEYELRDKLYHAILKSLGLREPQIIEFSRLTLQNTTVSKRSLRKLIDEKKVDGWDDPRLPTISGLRRRGFLPEAIKEFILSMGVSKVESEPTWDLLESINRKILDPLAKRYFFVPDPIEIRVEGAPALDVHLKYHPEQDYGVRTVKTDGSFFVSRNDLNTIPVGANARLIEAYNIRIVEKNRDKIVSEYFGEERLNGIRKFQWVSAKDIVPLDVKVPGALLSGGEFNPESLRVISGFAESAVKELDIGSMVQFVRFGFCRIDEKGVAILTHK